MAESALVDYGDSHYKRKWAAGNTKALRSANGNVTVGANQANHMDEPNPRGLPLNSGGGTVVVQFPFQLRRYSYGGFPCDYGHSVVLESRGTADATSRFGQLGLYTWDGKLYCGVDVEALASIVWRDVTTVDDIKLSCLGLSTQSGHVT